jgi:hypothetical protein
MLKKGSDVCGVHEEMKNEKYIYTEKPEFRI